MAFEEYFNSIRRYLPDDAKEVIADQVPKIKAEIRADVSAFAEAAGAQVEKELKAELERMAQERSKLLDDMKSEISNFVLQGGIPDALKKKAEALGASVDAYEQSVVKAGEFVRVAAKKGFASVGVPFA